MADARPLRLQGPQQSALGAGIRRDDHAFDVIVARTAKAIFQSDIDLRTPTRGNGCASERSGAAYATAEVRLEPGRMASWDRGFDAAGKQVWGATTGAYVFVKRAAAR